MIAACAVVFTGCTYFAPRTQPYRAPAISDTPAVDDGRTLYMRDCAWCHGDRGDGTDRGSEILTAPNGGAMIDFVLSTGRMPIGHPAERIQRKSSVYSPEQIDAIVGFVESLGPEGPEVPDPEVDPNERGRGAELYQENCAACHGSTAIGGALSSGRRRQPRRPAVSSGITAPPLDKSSPREVAEAMLVGPGTMPVFSHDTFSESEVDAIVSYVAYLQKADSRGGLPMGRIGPWSEGAAGWVVGLGLLLLLSRWIGEKRER